MKSINVKLSQHNDLYFGEGFIIVHRGEREIERDGGATFGGDSAEVADRTVKGQDISGSGEHSYGGPPGRPGSQGFYSLPFFGAQPPLSKRLFYQSIHPSIYHLPNLIFYIQIFLSFFFLSSLIIDVVLKSLFLFYALK